MGFRPGSPLQFDFSSSSDGGRDLSVASILVADDVGVAVGGGLDETVVGVLGEPGDELLAGVLVGSGTRVETLVLSAADRDGLDVTVGTDASSGDESGENSLGGERRHLEDSCVKK